MSSILISDHYTTIGVKNDQIDDEFYYVFYDEVYLIYDFILNKYCIGHLQDTLKGLLNYNNII